ncbi:MAG: ABC transporter substrate-binding protein [Galactobacillus timonensis]|uniref:ABC transporter substrate-binding protein n=1 Tax=Galactobacillus timonensis TaxID=2041840 RepID=UPI0023F0B891|nr:ABC transporter substrate-binding protein [Galactobacillus timonensis]MCI6066905.1 ABC transporter substrate-binding protein [Galactobacillus timonensis]MCI6753903.1 ABC transporter substrate-binding protein [Galactobacillus timonensis]MDD7087736.1 ABC transporter substrate-binding protein [Galactobacillus timonensis]MDY5221821.1 ABC transporter substrate-binding protein [Lachnospiraceae bacterium]
MEKSLLSMIKIVASAALAASMLVGCGSEAAVDPDVEIIDSQAVYGCSTINVYNAGEYIADETIPEFERRFTARVNYDVFDSNETLYTKLLGGSSYDVLVPSDYMIERLMSEDMLQPLDKSVVTNFSNIAPDVMDMVKQFDPEEQYAAPYFYGSVGLVYNNQVVDQEIIESEGWDILHDERYKGRVYAYDSQRDMFMVALKALGYSMNTEDPTQIQEAYDWLMEMNDAVDPAYVTDEVIDGMANGDMDIAIMYSGDAAYVISENSDMSYLEPSQGTNIWVDAMVIPANSSCPALANEFINFMMEDDIAQMNSEYVGYTSPNTAVRDYLSGELGDYFENPAYLPRSGYDKDEVFHFNEKMTRQLADLYTRVKMSAAG